MYFIQYYAFIFYLDLLRPRITKHDTVMRQAIPAEERLIATLRFLATGRSYEDLKFSTGIAAQTLGSIIPETCKAIYEMLQETYMKVKLMLYLLYKIYLQFSNVSLTI